MKLVSLFILISFQAARAQTQEGFRPGQFKLMHSERASFWLRTLGEDVLEEKEIEKEDQIREGGCYQYSVLTLDRADLLGNVAYLENKSHGPCRIYVPPQPRLYKITEVKKNRCGEMIYVGRDSTGRSIKIIDFRSVLCRYAIPGTLAVQEIYPNFKKPLYYVGK